MTKEMLTQYVDLTEESKELREKISRLATEARQAEAAAERMVSQRETAKDKVYGGYGGTQGFVIEGFPEREYEKKRTQAMSKRLLLEKRIRQLEELESKIDQEICEIERFISEIDDSHIRRIVRMRVIEGMPWEAVGEKMGGGNSGATVRQAFHRYVSENLSHMSQKNVV